MQHLFGREALTQFEHERIIAATGALSLKSAEIFFIDDVLPLGVAFSKESVEKIAALLGINELTPDSAPSFIVIPRIGTISPWSSKATEIMGACGLPEVRRVERGIAVWVLETDTTEALQAHLCDPMTQSVITAPQDAAAFQLHHDSGNSPIQGVGGLHPLEIAPFECREAIRVLVRS